MHIGFGLAGRGYCIGDFKGYLLALYLHAVRGRLLLSAETTKHWSMHCTVVVVTHSICPVLLLLLAQSMCGVPGLLMGYTACLLINHGSAYLSHLYYVASTVVASMSSGGWFTAQMMALERLLPLIISECTMCNK